MTASVLRGGTGVNDQMQGTGRRPSYGAFGLHVSLWPTEAIQAVTCCMRMTTVVEFACFLGTPGYPARTHPIKGHFTTYSGEPCIDHMPGGRFYPKTTPERCDATEGGARKDGCRRSKRWPVTLPRL